MNRTYCAIQTGEHVYRVVDFSTHSKSPPSLNPQSDADHKFRDRRQIDADAMLCALYEFQFVH